MRAVTDEYRRTTMKVLRLSFLSGFALELFASLAVALVAVQIGIRLIDRDMALQIGLFVLILAPEVFAPVRNVGTQFHAAAEGVEAAGRVLAIVERAERVERAGRVEPAERVEPGSSASLAGGGRAVTDGGERAGLRVRGARVVYDGHVVLDGLDADFPRGEVTALAGPSGVGKSTLFALVRGAVAGTNDVEAAVELSLDGAPIDAAELPARLAWMGQQPGLLQGTVRDNVALGRPDLPDAAVRDALELAGLGGIDPSLELGVGGAGLSGGQAQRLALARAIARARAIDADVVFADEPTSALDAERERDVIAALRLLADEGRAVVVVSHRRAVVAAADRVIELAPAQQAGTEPAGVVS